MPFTFSHPAIVLPAYYLPKNWRSFTGLIVGSVTPDFEMFIRMEAHNSYSHSWHSIFWFNLPLAIILSFLFHNIVRNALIDHLPYFLRQRLHGFKGFNWTSYFRQHVVVVILSMLVGTASHIFWDSFTHAYGIFIRWFPVLATEVVMGGSRLPVYTLLQLGFSVLGGLLILYSLLKLPKDNTLMPNKTGDLRYWLLVAIIALTLTAVRLWAGLDLNHYPNIIVVLISGGLSGMMLFPLIMKTGKHKQQE